MPTKKKQQDERDWSVNFADGGMDEMPLTDELKTSMVSFIDYSLTDRALPYIDSLKPVHRACLWMLWKMKLTPTAEYVKSQAIAGRVIAEVHPHSSDAAYGAAAGLTRASANDEKCGACSLNLALIDGHGNFGASFEDSPAAPRYTEMRLSKNGAKCVQDVPIGAVFMEPTFDSKGVMPELLPTRLPLLLINGTNGLAYGYNVSWLPHNPSEAIKACIYRIDNPKCNASDIKKIMPGPDFPSGGILIDREDNGLDAAFNTGFGNLSLTSRYEIVEGNRGRHFIDFYETPYRVARSGGKLSDAKPQSIVASITRFAQENSECGIVDIKNLSDNEHDCLIEVTIKAGVNAELVAQRLVGEGGKTHLTETVSYRQSAVLGSFEESKIADASGNENVLALTNPKPQDVSVIGYLDAFIDFRRACIINASNHEIKKAEEQKHLIDGMLKALVDIDKVISIVRKSEDKDIARTNLMKAFKVDEEQANYVLAIPLSRLTKSDKINLQDNSKKLADKIKNLKKIISSEKNIRAEIKRQLEEELEAQTLPRRTTIISCKGKVLAKAKGDRDKERAQHNLIIASAATGTGLSSDTDISNSTASEPNMLISRDTTIGNAAKEVCLTFDGKIGANADTGIIQRIENIKQEDEILVIYEDGSSTRLKPYEISSKPAIISKHCVGISTYNSTTPISIAMATSDGKVKVLDATTLTKNPDCPVMKVSTGAKILSARPVSNTDQQFVFVTSNANLLKFPVSSVNPQGRTSAGVAGIKLVKDARVVNAFVANEGDILVTNTGETIKVTPLSEYPAKGRGSQGVRCHKFLKGETMLIDVYVGNAPKRIDKKESLPDFAGRDASGTKQAGLKSAQFSE